MKKFLFCLIAVIMILGVVLVGCGGGGAGPQAVTVTFLIRTQDERYQMGNYIASQLENLGFTVTHHYGTSGQLAAIWQATDPSEGLWNAYTAGWVNTYLPRDESSSFGQFYTPLYSGGCPLNCAFTPTPTLLDKATKLWTGSFSSVSERTTLFQDALNLAMEDSATLFLVDRYMFSPMRTNVAVANDLAAGIYANRLWGQTIQFRDVTTNETLEPTGSTSMKVDTSGTVLGYPWNPVAGSNWAYDQFPIAATTEASFEFDVNTGLLWPHLASNATVYAPSTLGMLKSVNSTWCNLITTGGNTSVPGTAWADWNATSQQWITVGEKYGAGNTTAVTRTVVYYPTGTFGRPLQDGSTLSAADYMLHAILMFDRGKAASSIYDDTYAAELEAFLTHFKGMTWDTSTLGYDLIITTYDDQWYLDAEMQAYQESWSLSFSLDGQLGEFVWHNTALAILAEQHNQLAFSEGKADENSCEWLGYEQGPSMPILEAYVKNCTTLGNPLYEHIPYSTVMGAYVNATTALARYTNLWGWYNTTGNFWVASGPYYLYQTGVNQVVLKRFAGNPDPGNKWFFMMKPVPVYSGNHTGAWVDTITIKGGVSGAQAISLLQSNLLDCYAYGLTDKNLKTIVDGSPSLYCLYSTGAFNALQFNPSNNATDPFFPATGKLNPFAIPAIREAVNKAIDRGYIASNIMGGNGFARYTCISSPATGFAEPARYPSTMAAIASEYAYNLTAANATIYAAMMAIPGVTYTGGKYYYLAP